MLADLVWLIAMALACCCVAALLWIDPTPPGRRPYPPPRPEPIKAIHVPLIEPLDQQQTEIITSGIVVIPRFLAPRRPVEVIAAARLVAAQREELCKREEFPVGAHR